MIYPGWEVNFGIWEGSLVEGMIQYLTLIIVADLVALGTVMSVNLCGNKYVPFRPGRIDAVAADPKTGVPEPGTSLDATLNQFAQAGLNQSEAIILTACGHTLG